MKKVLIITAIAGLAMASCHKEYTCECSVNNGTSTQTAEITEMKKKKEADVWCQSKKGSTPGYTYDCKLK